MTVVLHKYKIARGKHVLLSYIILLQKDTRTVAISLEYLKN